MFIDIMRTTLNLPEELIKIAKDFAFQRHTSIGDAIAELMRRGLQPPILIDGSGSFPFVVVPPGTRPITLEATLKAQEDW